jgi:predicted GNAT family acetyltransferase
VSAAVRITLPWSTRKGLFDSSLHSGREIGEHLFDCLADRVARNVPLDEAIGWLVDTAPQGVVEWVNKDDPTVQFMLRFRENIFEDYTEEAFMRSLERRARIVQIQEVSNTGRKLVWFSRL